MNQYVYVFGGLSDYQILNSIEKYDIITDTWISLYFKLPVPLAKLATAPLLGGKSILIMGGMSADYEPNSNVY
jgi:N-acetylneuraminic acid mutarotase